MMNKNTLRSDVINPPFRIDQFISTQTTMLPILSKDQSPTIAPNVASSTKPSIYSENILITNIEFSSGTFSSIQLSLP